MDTSELLKKAQRGEQEAFGQLYDEFADRIFRFIKIKVNSQQQAEDILQETFLKAWRGLPGLKLRDCNFSAWLYRIAQNTITDHFRKLYRSPENLELDENVEVVSGAQADHEVIQQNTSEEVRRALAGLPLPYRQVLELRFLQDFSVSETASILNKTNLAVRLTQHRALKKLRLILNESYDLGYEKI